jgi:ubiquinone/menaquinone biosynthesis C-methylase UbiE
MTGKSIIVPVALCMLSGFFGSCVPIKAIFKKPKPYAYGWVPKKYEEVSKHYSDYAHWYNCKSGETIASIGAGNGKFEVAISCFMPGINWYLQEIDTLRLYQFDDVLAHFEKLKQSPIDATFHLVVGTESETNLPQSTFDRILMINVVHEINERDSLMKEIGKLLKPEGKLVIMERMGEKAGQVHGDCKFPKLLEKDLLHEMNIYGFQLVNKQIGEKMSHLVFYTFTLDS